MGSLVLSVARAALFVLLAGACAHPTVARYISNEDNPQAITAVRSYSAAKASLHGSPHKQPRGTAVGPAGCSTAVAGGGPGGVYFAWRLAQSQPSNASSICIFERSDRLGGRIYTLSGLGPQRDLTVELGAYRFNDRGYQEGAWYVYTPLTAAVIQGALRLHVAPYEPGTNSTMLKIVDAQGHNAGYHTFVARMLQEAEALGVRVFTQHTLASVAMRAPARSPGAALHPRRSLALSFREASDPVEAERVFLNLPQLPLLEVVRRSPSLLRSFPPALQVPEPVDGVKLYVHYDDAWWRTYLDLTAGAFQAGASGRQTPLLQGRYHDGDVRCDGAAAASANATCRGFIEATYVYADDAKWFITQELSTDPPYRAVNRSGGAESERLLDAVHEALWEHHAEALNRRGGEALARRVRAMRPAFALLSYWGAQTAGFGGAVHLTKTGAIPASELAPRLLQPFGAAPIFMANEAFGTLRNPNGTLGGHHGWAECSLAMTENVLSRHFGLPRPPWIDSHVYDQFVLYGTNSSTRS